MSLSRYGLIGSDVRVSSLEGDLMRLRDHFSALLLEKRFKATISDFIFLTHLNIISL